MFIWDSKNNSDLIHFVISTSPNHRNCLFGLVAKNYLAADWYTKPLILAIVLTLWHKAVLITWLYNNMPHK